MLIIGVDYHPSFQHIAFVNTETGECGERRLMHGNGEAETFYRELKTAGVKVRAGMEATGHTRWFEHCSQSSASNCGSGIPDESEPSGLGSRRRTVRMPNFS
jgi:hypothetical protein